MLTRSSWATVSF